MTWDVAGGADGTVNPGETMRGGPPAGSITATPSPRSAEGLSAINADAATGAACPTGFVTGSADQMRRDSVLPVDTLRDRRVMPRGAAPGVALMAGTAPGGSGAEAACIDANIFRT